MRVFRDWMNDNSLIDLPLNGRKFTWIRGKSRSIIDIYLCDILWIETFPSVSLRCISNFTDNISDHVGLLVELKPSQNWGPRPIRCINDWFLNSSLKPFVNTKWRKLEGWLFQRKLMLVKAPIRNWNQNTFGNIV